MIDTFEEIFIIRLMKSVVNTQAELIDFVKAKPDILFKNIASAIIIIDSKGVVRYANKYVKTISGYSLKSIIGKKFFQLVAPESKKQVLKAFKRLTQGKAIKPYELAILHKKGRIIHVKVSASPITYDKQVVAILGFAADITDQKQTVAHLSKMVKELSLLYDIGKQLTSTISLDLLLSKILLYLSGTFGYERTGILMINEDKKSLSIKATTKPFPDWQHQQKIRLGQGITGHVAKTGKAYMCNNVQEDKRFITFDKNSHSEITVPLKIGKKTIGVINVERYQKDAFDNDDLRILTLIANQAAIAIENSRLYESLEESYLDTIRALVSAMEAKDRYTRGHSERVRQFALKTARLLKLSESEMRQLNYAGYLHDIGKIGIADTLLSKVEPLTDEEYDLIKQHPDIGHAILKDVKHLSATCAIIRCEHERYDGNGYPNGLKQNQIPIGARIIAVADAFDAMTTDRPYHKAISEKAAIRILKKESAKQFDPRVIKAFLKILKNRR